MELTSFWDLIFNPVAQAKFVHTVGAGYVVGSMFVVAISSYYLLAGRFPPFAKRSIIVASAFGLAAALCVVILGDESGYMDSENQKMKLAAIEGMWQTEPAPAGFNLVGIPDTARRRVDYGIRIPWVLGIIATRSFTEPPGLKPSSLAKMRTPGRRIPAVRRVISSSGVLPIRSSTLDARSIGVTSRLTSACDRRND